MRKKPHRPEFTKQRLEKKKARAKRLAAAKAK